MRLQNIISITIILLTLSCTVPKEARILKKKTKDWRQSEKTLWGYSDSPFGSTTLTLRENNKFELESSGFFMLWFQAGTWTYKEDTIVLAFVDKQQIVNKQQKVYLDRQKSKFFFQNSDTTVLTLKVLFNTIKE